MDYVVELFWSEWFWLPPNITWKILETSNEGIRRAHASDLILALPAGFALIVLRIIFERIVAEPFCNFIGIESKKTTRSEPSTLCEKIYKSGNKNPVPKRVLELSHELNWTQSRIRRWFRQRRNQDLPSVMKKGKESCWRFFVYSVLVIFGGYTMIGKEWFYDSIYCFKGYPFHDLEDNIYWYFLIEMSLYVSMVITQFADVKRKDFWQMLTHHIATIILMYFSYSTNFFRIGAWIMFVHDVSDPLLEIAKVFNYAKRHTTCDVLFGIFALVFFVTRLYVYPTRVLYATVFLCYKYVQGYPAFYFLNGLLFILQILHLLWAYYVASAAYSFIIVGKVGKDTRSEAESSTDGEQHHKVPSSDDHVNHNMKNGFIQTKKIN